MPIKALITIALFVLATAKVYNTTINDITITKTCSDMYEEANCARCFNANAEDALLIKAQSLCYQCNIGSFYWSQGECVALPDHRDIPGWGRSCAECGAENYWSNTAKSCKPCSYEAAKCTTGGSCCNDTVDFACTNTFSLNNASNRCTCSKGDHFKLYDKCYCVGQDNVYMAIDESSKAVTCEACQDKCNSGCENFVCPEGKYLDGCECKLVHYTCKSASNDKEENCTECKSPFEFVNLTDGRRLCMCPCCMVEQNQVCVDNSAVSYLKDLACAPAINDEKWLASLIEKNSLKLLYKASRDGYDTQILESMVGLQVPLIIQILYQGKTFGYTITKWGIDLSMHVIAYVMDSHSIHEYIGKGRQYYDGSIPYTFVFDNTGHLKFGFGFNDSGFAIADDGNWNEEIGGFPYWDDVYFNGPHDIEVYLGI